jgi:hypothetical protein
LSDVAEGAMIYGSHGQPSSRWGAHGCNVCAVFRSVALFRMCYHIIDEFKH